MNRDSKIVSTLFLIINALVLLTCEHVISDGNPSDCKVIPPRNATKVKQWNEMISSGENKGDV